MIHIIAGRPTRSKTLLDAMFADRKRLFVDLLRWNVPVIDDRFEIDDFDGPGAVYIVAEEDGSHIGSLRLLPTVRPHLLDTLFGDLCPIGVPTGPDIREITRLCLPQRLGAERRRAVRNALIEAMVVHSLAHGVRCLTGVVEAAFRIEVLAMGWRAEPLGPTVIRNGARLGAFAIHVDAQTPERLRWTGIMSTGVSNDLQVAA